MKNASILFLLVTIVAAHVVMAQRTMKPQDFLVTPKPVEQRVR
jgi:hypothetical protein